MRCWYRYHRLFADVLRHRLQLAQPQNVHEYHRQVSAWFEQSGLAAEAIEHALATADSEPVARLIDDVASRFTEPPVQGRTSGKARVEAELGNRLAGGKKSVV
jgi:ATP/maltotriose-dependent transcriptional regulator MalT